MEAGKLRGMAQRTYQQYCPLARALDAVGERWSLLIIRELLGGPKRYTDLQDGLTGISPTLLARRLTELEAAGLIEQQVLPPPAARTVYALTSDGRALMPAIRELTQWGMHRLPEPGSGHRPGALMAARAALLAYAQPQRLAHTSRTYHVLIDGQPFTFAFAAGALDVRDGPPPATADLTVTVSAADIIGIRRNPDNGTDAAGSQTIGYEPNDTAQIAEFLTAFGLA
jgi:DNA-binding HxlR family transcriptional regulator